MVYHVRVCYCCRKYTSIYSPLKPVLITVLFYTITYYILCFVFETKLKWLTSTSFLSHNQLVNVLNISTSVTGTNRMYTFIRQELDIPFYHGQPEIDVWLNRILVAIQSRAVEGTLVDIFTSGAPAVARQNSRNAWSNLTHCLKTKTIIIYLLWKFHNEQMCYLVNKRVSKSNV